MALTATEVARGEIVLEGRDTAAPVLHRGGQALDQWGAKAEHAKTKGDGLFGGIGKLGGSLAGMLGPVGLATAGVGLLGAGFIGALGAASEEAVGVERLNTTLKNSLPNWTGNTDAVEKYIAKQQNLAFADDQLRDSLGFLVGQTGDLAAAQDLQATAMDLARAKGIDLQTATKAVGKVDQDSIGILKKLGIQVTDNMSKEEALAAIRKVSSGQAEAYANTTAGSMERLQGVFGNVVEDIGGALLPRVTAAMGGFADFVSSPDFQAGISTALDMIGRGFDFLGKAVEGVATFFAPVVPVFQEFIGALQSGQSPLQAFGDLLGNLGPVVMELGGQVVQAVSDALPGILAQLGEWGGAFVGWLGPKIPELIGKLFELGAALEGWMLGTALPTIIQKLGEWGKAFIDWVGPQIPPLLQQLGELAGQMWAWLIDTGLPTLTQKLGEWGKAFIDWVGPKIMPLLGELGNLLVQVSQWFVNDALPKIVAKLGEWGKAFIDWIGPKILPMLGELGKLAIQLGDWVTNTALPAIIGKLGEWGKAFLDWVGKDVLPFLAGKLGDIAAGIWKWITETAAAIPAKVGEIGGGLIEGIKSGVGKAWDSFVEYLSHLIKDNLPQFIKDWLGIKSPSRVMADGVGAPLIHGIKAGMEEASPALNETAASVVTGLMATISAALTTMGQFSGFVRPSDDIIRAFTDGLDFITDGFKRVIGKWNADTLVLLGQFGEGVGKLVQGLGGALDLFAKLSSFKKPADAALIAFSDSLDFFIDGLRPMIAKWDKDALELAGQFGDGVGKLLAGIGGALDLFAKFKDFKKPSDEALIAFRDSVDFFTDGFRSVTAKWNKETLAEAEKFSDAMGKFFGFVHSAVQAFGELKTLGKGDMTDVITGFIANIKTLFSGLFNGGDPASLIALWKSALDKDLPDSLPGLWRTGFNDMFAFIKDVWGPALDDQFKFWFSRWRGYFSDFSNTVGNFPDTGSDPGGGGGGGGHPPVPDRFSTPPGFGAASRGQMVVNHYHYHNSIIADGHVVATLPENSHRTLVQRGQYNSLRNPGRLGNS